MAGVLSTYLTGIYIYPVKSLGGIALNSCRTEKRGFPFDRRWLIVDKNNSFLTQRKHSIMSLLNVTVAEKELIIEHKYNSVPLLRIPFGWDEKNKIPVNVFDDQVDAVYVNDKAIEKWFSTILGEEVKLVFMDDFTKRPVDPDYASQNEEVSFADGFPYLITNQASLDDLNNRLNEPILMNRFRSNLVVGGGQPYEEDDWKRVKIGSAVFKVVKPCGRCKITRINQDTGEIGEEPLNTLSTYRKLNKKIIFGQYLILEKEGKVQVNDEVLIEYK